MSTPFRVSASAQEEMATTTEISVWDDANRIVRVVSQDEEEDSMNRNMSILRRPLQTPPTIGELKNSNKNSNFNNNLAVSSAEHHTASSSAPRELFGLYSPIDTTIQQYAAAAATASETPEKQINHSSSSFDTDSDVAEGESQIHELAQWWQQVRSEANELEAELNLSLSVLLDQSSVLVPSDMETMNMIIEEEKERRGNNQEDSTIIGDNSNTSIDFVSPSRHTNSILKSPLPTHGAMSMEQVFSHYEMELDETVRDLRRSIQWDDALQIKSHTAKQKRAVQCLQRLVRQHWFPGRERRRWYACCRIQKQWRRFYQRKRMQQHEQQLTTTTSEESHWWRQQMLASVHYNDTKEAARLITTMVRRLVSTQPSPRQRHLKMMAWVHAAIVIQSQVRRHRDRSIVQRRRAAVKTIHDWLWPFVSCVRNRLRQDKAATCIAAAWKAYTVETQWMAARTLQRAFRIYNKQIIDVATTDGGVFQCFCRRDYQQRKQVTPRNKPSEIQRIIRQYHAEGKCLKLVDLRRELAAIRVACYWRRYAAHCRYQMQRTALLKIQEHFHNYQAEKLVQMVLLEQYAAVIMQSVVRRHVILSWYQEAVSAILMMQRFIRGGRGRRHCDRLRTRTLLSAASAFFQTSWILSLQRAIAEGQEADDQQSVLGRSSYQALCSQEEESSDFVENGSQQGVYEALDMEFDPSFDYCGTPVLEQRLMKDEMHDVVGVIFCEWPEGDLPVEENLAEILQQDMDVSEIDSANCIQGAWRTVLVQRQYLNIRMATITCQCIIRRFLARCMRTRKISAIVTIQAARRRALACRISSERELACRAVQRSFRTVLLMQRLRRVRISVIHLQRYWRLYSAKKVFKLYRAHRSHACCRLQAAARDYIVRTRAIKLTKQRSLACCSIQRCFKTYQSKKDGLLSSASKKIQTAARRYLERKHAAVVMRKQHIAAQTIKDHIRGALCRRNKTSKKDDHDPLPHWSSIPDFVNVPGLQQETDSSADTFDVAHDSESYVDVNVHSANTPMAVLRSLLLLALASWFLFFSDDDHSSVVPNPQQQALSPTLITSNEPQVERIVSVESTEDPVKPELLVEDDVETTPAPVANVRMPEMLLKRKCSPLQLSLEKEEIASIQDHVIASYHDKSTSSDGQDDDGDLLSAESLQTDIQSTGSRKKDERVFKDQVLYETESKVLPLNELWTVNLESFLIPSTNEQSTTAFVPTFCWHDLESPNGQLLDFATVDLEQLYGDE
jgi:hypothetical protein